MSKKSSANLLKKLNEPGGKLFELLSYLLLERIFDGLTIEFQPRPSFMLIDPDLAVIAKGKYHAIALVTHATAKNAAGVKIDRSLEELFELKTRGSTRPLSINLIWHSPFGWTAGQLKRLDEAFDTNWVAFRDAAQYKPRLPKVVSLAQSIEKMEHDEALEAVRCSGLVDDFLPELEAQLNSKKSVQRHKALWNAERKRLLSLPHSAGDIDNHVKLDLTALLLMPPGTLPKFLKGQSVDYHSKFDPALASKGLERRRRIGSDKVVMPQDLVDRVSTLVASCGVDTLEVALASAREADGFASFVVAFEPLPTMTNRISQLRAITSGQNFRELVKNSWESSDALWTGTCWPLEFTVALYQECKDQGYGLLTLQRQALGGENLSFGWDPLWRYSVGEKDQLNEAQLQAVCDVASERLSEILSRSTDRVLATRVQERIAKRIRRKKKTNPLLWFVRHAMEEFGLTAKGFPSPSVMHQCPFAAIAGLPKQSGLTRWHFAIEENHAKYKIAHVLSSYSSTHKHKEYSVKSRLAFYVADGKVKDNTGLNGIAILLDGKWSSSETELLRNAGVTVFSIDDVEGWVDWLK